MLNGKTALLCVTGGIAAYKMPNVARMLVKMGCDVRVLMTEHAANFITATTFETLTGHKCLTDTFDRDFEFSVEHVALAKQADVVLVAPATANVIGKIANGIADDMVTTTVMACTCPILVAPAMNHNMYHNPIVQENLDKLRRHGYTVIEPTSGMLANGDMGDGRLPDESLLVSYVLREIAHDKDMAGMRVLVTAGPTQEAIDPVRYITNHSTGKMGYAVAERAMRRGADVTLVTGPVAIEPPPFVDVVHVTTAAEMYDAVISRADAQDIIIKAAAVADYRPAQAAAEKIKKSDGEATLTLERTADILAELGRMKARGSAQAKAGGMDEGAARSEEAATDSCHALLCGFSMETEHLLENSIKKLAEKNLDMIAANSLREPGAGFGTDTNVLTLITRGGERELPMMDKGDAADCILDGLMAIRN